MGTIGNVIVQPMSVTWNSVDLGFTDGDFAITVDEKSVDILAHQEGQNVLDSIRTGKHVEVDITLKETVLSQLQTLLAVGGGNTGSVAQVETFATVADSSGSLNNTVMFFSARHPTTLVLTDYYIWFNINSAGTDPAIPSRTAVPVTGATGVTANNLATAIRTALNAITGTPIVATGATNSVIMTHAVAGVITLATMGDTGFTLSSSTAGVSSLYGWGKSQDFTSKLSSSQKLILHPVALASNVKTQDINFWKAYPDLSAIDIAGEKPRTIKVKFHIFPDTSKADAIRLFAVGDGS